MLRPLESLLLLANLLSFVVLIVPRLRALAWTVSLPLIALLIAVVHLVFERYRWPMVPAYVLTAVLLVAWWLQRQAWSGRPVSGTVVGIAIGLGVLGFVVAAVLPVIVPVFHFPSPSGPHAIGTLTYHWTDSGRPEVFTKARNDARELVVQIWYPAEEDPAAPRAPYMQDSRAIAFWFTWLLRVRLPQAVSGQLTSVTTNAVTAAPIATTEPSYPVLIFVEGLSGFRQMNTFLFEELVSHGYIVAAIDQPYVAAAMEFPDGREIFGLPKSEIWPLIQQSVSPEATAPEPLEPAFPDGIISYLARDAVFALDQLTALNIADPHEILAGHLDLERAGIVGVSLGGIVSPQACRMEPRFRACLTMEAPITADVVDAGLEQPTLLIIGDVETMRQAGWSEADIHQHQTTIRALFENLAGDGYFVTTHGMFHLNLTDAPLLLPLPLRVVGLLGPIDVRRGHDIVKAFALAFFDRHLKGRPASLLDGPSQEVPEVRFERKR